MEIPDTIVCIDCGQPARRLTPEPEEGWQVGDSVAYRCTGCNDRWDMEISSEEQAESAANRAHALRTIVDERKNNSPEKR